MTPRGRTLLRAVLLAATVASGAAVLACAFLLARDQAQSLGRVAADAPRIAELEAATRSDSAAAGMLNDVHRGEADATLADRARRAGWIRGLIGSALVLVASAKGAQVLAGWRPPALATLDALRREAASTPLPADVLRGRDWPALDLEEVDAIVAREGSSREAAIPILNALLARFGYLPDAALRRVCERTEITPAQIAGNSTFYANFRSAPVGRHVLRVCHGTACHVAGSRRIEDEVRRHLSIPSGADTDERRDFTLDRVACLGCCSLAPVLMVGEWTAGRLTPEGAVRTVEALKEGGRA